MSRLLASVLLGVSCFFLASCCIIYRLLDQLVVTDTSTTLHHSLFRGDRGRPRPRRRSSPSGWRQQYEANMDPTIITSTVQGMRFTRAPDNVDSDLGYDIHRCPAVIPDNYPVQWKALDVLANWNPDNTTVPPKIYQGICALDWKDPIQQELAQVYRQAEKPFLVLNHPEIWKAAERWSHYDYLFTLLGGDDSMYRNEHSRDNHMPYWKLRGPIRPPPGWVPPTDNVKLSFADWYDKAMKLEESDSKNIADSEHYYFRFNGVFDGDNAFLYDELPLFLPTQKTFFMPEPENQRGINCRFGSKGIIAETHYDFSRNFIIILKGQKRYILSHPNQCENLELYPQGHPSARHSKVDWSNPDQWHSGRFPQAHVNEVILQPGDALYLPTSWFHFIVSLNLNYQCNARSGTSTENLDAITKCGFSVTA